MSSCSNTRFLKSDEALLHKVNIKVDTDEEEIENIRELKKGMMRVTNPKPNKRWLGAFKVNLWFYNIGNPKKGGVSGWMANKVGEPPVLFDSSYLYTNSRIVERYLFNNGYFHPEVDYEVKLKKRRATVTYSVKLNDLYRLDSIHFQKDSTLISDLIQPLKKTSLLKSEAPFSEDNLKGERERIVRNLKDQGYYNFRKDFINYEIDSSRKPLYLDLYMNLDSASVAAQEKYFLNDIYIHTNYSRLRGSRAEPIKADTTVIGNYHYISSSKRFRAKSIIDLLLLEKGGQYSLTNHEYTLNHLLEPGTFKFVNINYDQVADTSLLDVNVFLSAAKKLQISAEIEASNRFESSFGQGYLGSAVKFSYRDRNIFRGLEQLSFNLFGGVEFDLRSQEAFINTIDLSAQVNFTFYKALWPLKRFFKRTRLYVPKTNISLSNNFITRVNLYSVNGTELSYGFDWRNQRKNMRHQLGLATVSFFNLLKTQPAFDEQLAASQRLQKGFEEKFIIGSNYTFLYSNQDLNSKKDFMFFRGNLDVAGNSLQLIESILRKTNVIDNEIKLFGVNYSEFVRLEGDLRYYLHFGRDNQLVTRFYSSIGIPYGKPSGSNVLPFIKQYFAGGSNGVRAFPIRGIGPGSYGDEEAETVNEFERTGDMKIELNVEYRFPILDFIKGAFFVDAGNIWTLVEDENRPGSKFQFDRFYKEIAIGGGMGVRLDFNYFILRFDFAIPFRKPYLPEGDRWVLDQVNFGDKDWRSQNLRLNLGIGYPF